LTVAFGTSQSYYRTLSNECNTLVVVERVGDLIHDEVRMPEEAMDSIVQINADIVLVFLEA
jgi:hypothetical protein